MQHHPLVCDEVVEAVSPPTGAVCIPSCIIPPSDPVILPENVTAETMDYRLQPTRVQVSGEADSVSRELAGSTEGVSPLLHLVFFNQNLFALGEER